MAVAAIRPPQLTPRKKLKTDHSRLNAVGLYYSKQTNEKLFYILNNTLNDTQMQQTMVFDTYFIFLGRN